MYKVTIKALLETIEHWERLRDGKEESTGILFEAPGRSDCVLCQRFDYREYSGRGYRFTCDRRNMAGKVVEICPVRKKTGEPVCQGSPYQKAQDAWVEINDEGKRRTKKRIEAMDQEVRFLVDLLPEDHERRKQ